MRGLGDKGLTFAELIVVLAIISIAAALGIPHLKKWYCYYRLSSFSSELHSYMQLSRLFSMSYGYNTYILFIPESSFVAFYVDDIDSESGKGKIDRDVSDVDGDGDRNENESDHITFPLPDTIEASYIPPSRKRNLNPTDTVKGIRVPSGMCEISFERPDGVPKVPTTSSSDDITFSGNQAMFSPDGTGKAGAVYISNSYGSTFAVTVSVAGRVKLWEYVRGEWK